MTLKNIFILVFSLNLYGCSDYQTGYKEGYQGNDKNQWVVFGKEGYFEGYHSGQAEMFQQDWLAENPVETSLLQCPTTFIHTDPLNVLPTGYEQIAQDVYQIVN